jgi:hypothetical protein
MVENLHPRAAVKRTALFALLALPVSAQDRFSITTGRYAAGFSTARAS